MSKKTNKEAQIIRKLRIRRKITGTSDMPRLNVYRGNKHIYTQIIDDTKGCTLASASSRSKELIGKINGNTCDTAKEVGNLLAEKAKEKGIERVVFDRGGYKYHGKVKALADAARAGGLKF
jgi:large subunit ribosomal protein L18